MPNHGEEALTLITSDDLLLEQTVLQTRTSSLVIGNFEVASTWLIHVLREPREERPTKTQEKTFDLPAWLATAANRFLE